MRIELTGQEDGKQLRVNFEVGEVFTDHGIAATLTARVPWANASSAPAHRV